MIKKAVFEDDLISGMFSNLTKLGSTNLDTAIDHLNSAIDILVEQGMQTEAEKILDFLTKIANHHTKGLTPEKQVKNLLHHGTQFNMVEDHVDDNYIEDILNTEINDDVEVSESDYESDFEDEK